MRDTARRIFRVHWLLVPSLFDAAHREPIGFAAEVGLAALAALGGDGANLRFGDALSGHPWKHRWSRWRW